MSDEKGDWKAMLGGVVVVAILVCLLFFIVFRISEDAKKYHDERWHKLLIEKGHGTYKDGKFEWKEP